LKLLASLLIAVAGIAAPGPKAATCSDAWRLTLPSPGKIGVYFDPKLPVRYRVAFAEALKYWEQTIDIGFHDEESLDACGLEVTLEDKNTPTDVLAESILPFDPSFDGAVRVNVGGSIDKIPDDKLVYVFVHELGHVFGLNHSKDQSSVMYADTTGGILLLPDDLKELSLYHRVIRPVHQISNFEVH